MKAHRCPPNDSTTKLGTSSTPGSKKPIYTRNVFAETVTDGASAAVLEARISANSEELARKPYRKAGPARGDRWRPAARAVPVGTALHLPNEHTMLGKPYGQRFLRHDASHNQDYNASAPWSKHSDLATPRNLRPAPSSIFGLRRPSFRRAYGTIPSTVATTSAIKIEDLDGWTYEQDGGNVKDGTADDQHFTLNESREILPKMAMPLQSVGEGGVFADSFSTHASQDVVREPKSERDVIKYLGSRIAASKTKDNLSRLRLWHDKFPSLRSTASHNYLLQLAYDIRDLRSFNNILLTDMPAAGFKPDSTTWDLYMETWARRGRWDRVVSVWNERRDAQVPLNRIGWTRILRAATKRGTTTLSQAEIGKTLNPIYSALYDLPKGVRQVQLHKIVRSQKMDVDEMLSLMMPDDLLPLDFQATLAIAHRLVKQTRWKEAEDVVALWLDRTDETWEAAEPPMTYPEIGITTEGCLQTSFEHQRTIALRKQQSLALLHILLEGLVLTRNLPEVIVEYLERYMTSYQKTAVAPTYHTLFLILTACRLVPLRNRFQTAFEMFQRLDRQYSPPQDSLADLYGLSRCFRQMEDYGRLTLGFYNEATRRRQRMDILGAISTDLQSLRGRLKTLQANNWSGRMEDPVLAKHSRKSRHGKSALPPKHILAKEVWRSIRNAWEREGLDFQRKEELPAPWQKSPWLKREQAAVSSDSRVNGNTSQ